MWNLRKNTQAHKQTDSHNEGRQKQKQTDSHNEGRQADKQNRMKVGVGGLTNWWNSIPLKYISAKIKRLSSLNLQYINPDD